MATKETETERAGRLLDERVKENAERLDKKLRDMEAATTPAIVNPTGTNQKPKGGKVL